MLNDDSTNHECREPWRALVERASSWERSNVAVAVFVMVARVMVDVEVIVLFDGMVWLMSQVAGS